MRQRSIKQLAKGGTVYKMLREHVNVLKCIESHLIVDIWSCLLGMSMSMYKMYIVQYITVVYE
jgi:hypothetical protein